jgi:hypothetical protein
LADTLNDTARPALGAGTQYLRPPIGWTDPAAVLDHRRELSHALIYVLDRQRHPAQYRTRKQALHGIEEPHAPGLLKSMPPLVLENGGDALRGR